MGGRVFLHISVSLDGFIERENHDIDWHFVDDEFEEYINDVLRSIDGMIFGRVAHEKLAEYWPMVPSGAGDRAQAPARGISDRHLEAARMMNELPKYVVSNSAYTPTWGNSHVLTGDLRAEIAKLKEQHDRDIALFAGAGVAQSFMELGLLDAYKLVVNPIILGSGTPLFKAGVRSIPLQLEGIRTFQSGALVLSYIPAGRPET
jgi:dihydrofolate reductase